MFQACWVLHYFSEIEFKQEQILVEAIRLTTNAFLTDQDLPVKVEAAIALQMLLSAQKEARKYIEPFIKQITLELLRIIRETENDDLTIVMQKLVYTYTSQLMPIAVEICQHLVKIKLFFPYPLNKCNGDNVFSLFIGCHFSSSFGNGRG